MAPSSDWRLSAVLLLCGTLCLSACDRQSPSKDAPNLASAGQQGQATPSDPSPPPAPTTAPNHLSQQAPIIRDDAKIEKPRHRGIYTPPPGSAERVALMNALRGQVRGEVGADVVFVVTSLHSNGEWAFGQLEPNWPDGRAIRIEGTPAYKESPHMDGLRTEAIWRRVRGRWTVFAHAVGSTDIWWLEHCDRVPKGLMRGCDS